MNHKYRVSRARYNRSNRVFLNRRNFRNRSNSAPMLATTKNQSIGMEVIYIKTGDKAKVIDGIGISKIKVQWSNSSKKPRFQEAENVDFCLVRGINAAQCTKNRVVVHKKKGWRCLVQSKC